MRKINVHVWESIRFEHEVLISVPDEVDIEKMLDRAEKDDCFDDVQCTLKKYGCKILDVCVDDSGSDITIEIPEYDDDLE